MGFQALGGYGHSSRGLVTIDHEEEQGSPQSWFDRDGWHGQRRINCAWDDAKDLVEQLAGSVRNMGDSSYRELPQQFPGNSRLGVARVHIEPYPGARAEGEGSGASRCASYNKALLTVDYEETQWSDDEESSIYKTETLEPAAEFLTVGELYWYSGGTAEKIAGSNRPGILLPFLDWTITWHGLTRIPSSAVDLVGKINDAPLQCGIKGVGSFGTHTVLYRCPVIERNYVRNAIDTYDVSFRFQVRDNGGNGWNYFPRAKGNQVSWEQVYYASGDSYTAQEFYASGDLSVLV